MVGGAAKQDSGSSDGDASVPVIDKIDIKNVSLVYMDGQTKQKVDVQLDQIQLASQPGDKVMLTVAGAVNGLPLKVTGSLDSLAELAGDPDNYKVDLALKALNAAIGVKGGVGHPLSNPNLNLTATIKAADLDATIGEVKKLVPQLAALKLPPLGALDLQTGIKGGGKNLALAGLKLVLGPTDHLALTASGGVKNLTGTPAPNVTFQIKGRDLSKFSALAGVTLPKGPPYQVSGVATTPGGDYAINNFKLQLGGTDISGTIKASIKGPVPRY